MIVLAKHTQGRECMSVLVPVTLGYLIVCGEDRTSTESSLLSQQDCPTARMANLRSRRRFISRVRSSDRMLNSNGHTGMRASEVEGGWIGGGDERED